MKEFRWNVTRAGDKWIVTVMCKIAGKQFMFTETKVPTVLYSDEEIEEEAARLCNKAALEWGERHA